MQKIRFRADVPTGSNNSGHPQMTQLRPYLHLNKPAYKTLFQQYNDSIYSYILIRTMHNEVLRWARNTQHQTTDNITIIRIGNALVYDLCFLTWFQLLYKITFQTSPTKIESCCFADQRKRRRRELREWHNCPHSGFTSSLLEQSAVSEQDKVVIRPSRFHLLWASGLYWLCDRSFSHH